MGSYPINGSGLTANNGNYSFVQAAGNATALTITQAAATVAGAKVYTGTTGFVVGQLSVIGGVNGETLSLTAGAGTAASANVGSASGTLAGLALSVSGGNALASNYLLPTTGVFDHHRRAADLCGECGQPGLWRRQSGAQTETTHRLSGERHPGQFHHRNAGLHHAGDDGKQCRGKLSDHRQPASPPTTAITASSRRPAMRPR